MERHDGREAWRKKKIRRGGEKADDEKFRDGENGEVEGWKRMDGEERDEEKSERELREGRGKESQS